MKEEEIILDKTKSLSGITFPTKEKIGNDINNDKDFNSIKNIFIRHNITEQEKCFISRNMERRKDNIL